MSEWGSAKALQGLVDERRLDRKTLDILKPKGFLGSFNLCSHNILNQGLTAGELREFYSGYELTNHCKLHPRLAKEEYKEQISLSEEVEPGLYRYTDEKGRTYHYAEVDAYKRLVDSGKRELEEIFGEGSIRAFVWPYCDQKSPELDEYFKQCRYTSVRRTGAAPDFNLPSDRMHWAYNAIHSNLLEKANEFDALSDDGKLKYFCFGVHSHDFENNDCWEVLVKFAEKYGNRPTDFWYATVGDIFDYEDAVSSLIESGDTVTNPSELPIYLELDGKKTVINPKTTVKI